MKTYDVKCPICGAINHNLYMEETDGWMECEKCGRVVKVLHIVKTKKIPLYSGKEIAARIGIASG